MAVVRLPANTDPSAAAHVLRRDDVVVLDDLARTSVRERCSEDVGPRPDRRPNRTG